MSQVVVLFLIAEVLVIPMPTASLQRQTLTLDILQPDDGVLTEEPDRFPGEVTVPLL
jgi:hypothetical protein